MDKLRLPRAGLPVIKTKVAAGCSQVKTMSDSIGASPGKVTPGGDTRWGLGSSEMQVEWEAGIAQPFPQTAWHSEAGADGGPEAWPTEAKALGSGICIFM